MTQEMKVALESYKPSTFAVTDDEARRIAALYGEDVTIYKTRSGKFTLSQPKANAFGDWGSIFTVIGGQAI